MFNIQKLIFCLLQKMNEIKLCHHYENIKISIKVLKNSAASLENFPRKKENQIEHCNIFDFPARPKKAVPPPPLWRLAVTSEKLIQKMGKCKIASIAGQTACFLVSIGQKLSARSQFIAYSEHA